MAEIDGRCESEKERQQLSAINQARKPYVESYQRALHLLVDENKQDAAARVIVNETLPALFKYHAAWDEFVDFQKGQLDLAAEQAQRDYAKARRLTSSLVLMAVVIAVSDRTPGDPGDGSRDGGKNCGKERSQ